MVTTVYEYKDFQSVASKIPPEMLYQLKLTAVKRRTSVSALIRESLGDYLATQEQADQ